MSNLDSEAATPLATRSKLGGYLIIVGALLKLERANEI
jgi:hypothetical protein